MKSSYMQLPTIQKVCFISWLFDLSNEYGNLALTHELLAEKPYTSAFLCQTATMEQFQVNGSPEFYKLFSGACVNARLFELEQLATEYKEEICQFIIFLKIQDDSTQMYQVAMKFINQLKQTKTLANIEKEAATFENME